MDLRESIFEAVLAAGFDRVGCLPLEAADDPGLRDWIASGRHGEMKWIERHAAVRDDPSAAFPGYRSVVVAALEYGEVAAAPRDPAVANLSRYALGDDYHGVLKERLLAAADSVRSLHPGLRARAFVDAGPLNEKLIAARAGLGWVGRHTNLIDPARGSYLFLGLLLVDAELPATGPAEPDRCGTCTACIPACPTGAIVAPYELDARRCISYLTIELRGPIPRELRPGIGNRVFGCDVCQEVCPWNRFAQRTPPAPFRPREGLRSGSLADWLELSPTGFEDVFRDSAVTRPGYEGFLRNVLVAAGNSRRLDLAGGVTSHLGHPSALVRGHAAWALGCLAPPGGIRALRDRARLEQDPWVRGELAAALAAIRKIGEKKL